MVTCPNLLKWLCNVKHTPFFPCFCSAFWFWEYPPTIILVASSLDSCPPLRIQGTQLAMQKPRVQVSTLAPRTYISLSLTHLSHSLQVSKKTTAKMAALSLHSKPLLLQFMLLIIAFILGTRLHAADDPSLTLDYYASICPTVLETVKKQMECAVLSDPRNAAAVLRLHFHDCFVQVYIFISITWRCFNPTDMFPNFIISLSSSSSNVYSNCPKLHACTARPTLIGTAN